MYNSVGPICATGVSPVRNYYSFKKTVELKKQKKITDFFNWQELIEVIVFV